MELTKRRVPKVRRVCLPDVFLQLPVHCPRAGKCHLQEKIPLASMVFHLKDWHHANQKEITLYLEDVYKEEFQVPLGI